MRVAERRRFEALVEEFAGRMQEAAVMERRSLHLMPDRVEALVASGVPLPRVRHALRAAGEQVGWRRTSTHVNPYGVLVAVGG